MSNNLSLFADDNIVAISVKQRKNKGKTGEEIYGPEYAAVK